VNPIDSVSARLARELVEACLDRLFVGLDSKVPGVLTIGDSGSCETGRGAGDVREALGGLGKT